MPWIAPIAVTCGLPCRGLCARSRHACLSMARIVLARSAGQKTVICACANILRQPRGLFHCFHGENQQDTLCAATELAGAEIIRTTGGHHFGGDYSTLAEKIPAGVERRLHAIAGNGGRTDLTSR